MARILLIDDDDNLRGALAMILTHFGHTVTVASDGKQGLALFEKERPELVITDIVMPEKDGVEILVALRKARPSVKTIAISGGGLGSAEEYLHLARHLGADRVIPKPFPSEKLIAVVAELMSAPAAAARPDAPAPKNEPDRKVF